MKNDATQKALVEAYRALRLGAALNNARLLADALDKIAEQIPLEDAEAIEKEAAQLLSSPVIGLRSEPGLPQDVINRFISVMTFIRSPDARTIYYTLSRGTVNDRPHFVVGESWLDDKNEQYYTPIFTLFEIGDVIYSAKQTVTIPADPEETVQ